MRFSDESLRIEPLSSHHDRAAFSCGNESLDRYIQTQASQDMRRGIARVFVAIMPQEPSRIAGYFTLSAAWVVASDLPAEVARRLPRHPIPAALVGRLAVATDFARRGLGSILLADAVQKTMAAAKTVAMTVAIVDPIDDAARTFYAAFGFQSLQGPQRLMFLILPRNN